MAGNGNHHMRSFAERARSVLTDDRLKQAGAVTEDVAARAEEASKTATRKVAQQDAWDELRSDVELLTEIARAHHALITDLIDRIAGLEARTGIEAAGHDD
jgi:hypothetical protein